MGKKSCFLLFVLFAVQLSIFLTCNIASGLESSSEIGKWQISDQKKMSEVVAAQLKENVAEDKPLMPVVQEFKQVIENDPELFMLFHQMFQQLPDKPEFKANATGDPQITNYHQMLQVFNDVLYKAPQYDSTPFLGFPIART